MCSPIRHACLLLLALPAAALAAPVTVVTHSAGILSVHPNVLSALGQQETPAEDNLPYEMTLTSTFDQTGVLPARGEGASAYGTQVVVDFRMGDLTYHYAGTEWSSVGLYSPSHVGGDSYRHEIGFDPYPDSHGYSFSFEHVLLAAAGGMGTGGPLSPATFEGNDRPAGYTNITAFYVNDEYGLLYQMSGGLSTYSVRITSPVPEPASFGLLAAGLVTLGMRRRCIQRRDIGSRRSYAQPDQA